MKIDDTIVAIATTLAPSGIGVVRVSGKQAFEFASSLFRPAQSIRWQEASSHRLYHGWIHDEQGSAVDEVLLALMRAPSSYTTEDVIEVQCHGSPMVLETVVRLFLNQGARLAEPGEFTQRAFYYGRMDLTQVEAVADIIHTQSTLGLQTAVNQLRGNLYQTIMQVKKEVSSVAALVEATIDFTEEEEIFTDREDCLLRLTPCIETLSRLANTADQGKRLRSGVEIAFVGRPNVGKSSLLNTLLQEERAIVTHIPGTTRDLIEETIQIEGLAARIIDTAGIRHTKDEVESVGIQRSRNAWKQADLVLLLLESSQQFSEEDEELLRYANPENTIIVINKIDLGQSSEMEQWINTNSTFDRIEISAKEHQGIEALKTMIFQKVIGGEVLIQEETQITNLRQQQTVEKALSALQQVKHGLENELEEELLAVDLRSALHEVGDIVGETTADDLLNQIFSEFCIGK